VAGYNYHWPSYSELICPDCAAIVYAPNWRTHQRFHEKGKE
jgi:hypothetical protein